MEKYLVPPESSLPKPTSASAVRRPWKRSLIELNGRFDANYRQDLYTLAAHSYLEIGRFPHFYHKNEEPCPTHMRELQQHYLKFRGVTGLEFDNQGIYVVSVTRSGCLTVHDFETLYCQSKVGPGYVEDESKHVVHFTFPLGKELDVARWNPTNQNEIACTSRKEDEVLILISVICLPNQLRIFTSDALGTVHVWDRRASLFPCTELSANRHDSFNSIQIYADNQITTIFGAGKEGIIHIWDLRGGRNSTAFQSRKDMSHLPLTSLHLGPMLQKIASLKAQTEIVPKEIHSINVNPSSPHQLAFHLDDGWSGVLDIYKSEVTHVHCPPPAWLDGSMILRKPSWLPTSSIYVVGSMSEKGIHVLDFHPSSRSPCHVDYDEDSQRKENRNKFYHNNKFVSLSETVTNCVAHPLNSMIVAGTQIYVVRSMSEKGIHVLDFHPSSKSPCHINEDLQRKENRDKFYHNNKFVSLRETVTNCTAHPLNIMIVAGTLVLKFALNIKSFLVWTTMIFDCFSTFSSIRLTK